MRQALSIGIVFLGVGATAPAARAGARAAFLYALSDPTERAQYGADLAWDRFNSELYVTGPGVVSVFGDSGMMVHQFAEDPDAGIPIGVAPVGDRELVVLTLWQGATRVYRCNFRGDPIARIPLPAEFESFGANGIATANGNVYLVNKQALRVLALGLDGSKVGYFDLGPQLGFDEAKRADNDLRGFSVDRAGNLLMTIPTQFAAYVVSPEGRVRSFGQRGSSAGKFSVVAGIAADDEGHIYVTDILRAVVMVFDAGFRFLGEFGYRGGEPGNLVGPSTIVIGNGRAYVSQSVGPVKVFGMQFD